MKSLLTSRFAAFAASAAAAIIGFLVSKDLVLPEVAPQATGELTILINGLISALGAILVLIVSLVFKRFSGGNSGGGKSSNGSGGTLRSIFVMAAACSFAGFALPSCASLGSAVTGQPIPATSVQRAGNDTAPVVMVSSTDLAQAEAQAEAAEKAGEKAPVHGLYDAGRAAEAIRDVFPDRSARAAADVKPAK